MTKNVFLIGKNEVFKEGLRSLLNKNNFHVAGEYGSVSDLLQSSRESKSGSIIIHTGDSAADVIEKTLSLRSAFAQSRVVVIGPRTETPLIMPALTAGVDGYLLQDISCEALLGSLRLIAAGEKVYPTFMLSPTSAQASKSVANDVPENIVANMLKLSPQEMKIVHGLANGDPNKIIAHNLNISESTVKVHVRTILRKMGVKNRTQAALLATTQRFFNQPDSLQLKMNV